MLFEVKNEVFSSKLRKRDITWKEFAFDCQLYFCCPSLLFRIRFNSVQGTDKEKGQTDSGI